jgi:hypothetical protein
MLFQWVRPQPHEDSIMSPDLLAVIRAARRRWRLRVFLHGLAWVGVGGLVVVLFAAWGVDRFRFSPTALTAFRALAWGTIAGLFLWRVLRPLARRITDEQVALYLEEHESSLDGSVLGAVTSGDVAAGNVSPALVDRIVARAVERLASVDGGRRIERPTLQRSGGVLAAVAAVGLGIWLLGPGGVRTGLPFVVSPFRDAAGSPYGIAVLPGDSTAARGADVRIRAELRNFTAEDVTLVLRSRGAVEWERVEMQRGDEGDALEYLLFDVRDTTEYFVTAGGVRSPVHTLSVADLPYVERLALLYHFPAYSGLEPVREEDGGDIAALVGTLVQVEVQPTIATAAGALLVGTDTVALAPGETVLTGQIEVRESGSYRVLLATQDGRLVPASPEYFIDALDDQPPVIRFSKPGRDVSVTSVDEVFAEVSAEDDYGLQRVELVYAVNGGSEITRQLYGGRGLRKDVTAGHTLYLEEMSLVPGDVVAYYARAADARRGGVPAVTDIYFVTVRPFDRTWRAAEARGTMAGQEGGGASPGELSNRQRDIIAATFRLVRDRARFDPREWLDNLGTVTLMQGRLREEVQTLVRRFQTRGVADLDSTLATVAEALPLAAAAMQEAEERLGRRSADSALSPEQRALQQLQRAEAAFRDRQVQLGQQGGSGGGGGGAASAEELADLFDLEMDRLRNQYESVERGARQQAEQQADEALEKLRELARRQQQENERRRAQAAGDPNAGTGAGQRRLADEAEELGRRLERLAREQNNAELSDAARRLQDAASAMRRAAAGQRGTAQGEAAAEQLREARRRLEGSRGAAQQRDMQDALRRAERLVEQQNELRDRLRDVPADGTARSERLRQLAQRKEGMAEEVDQLESALDRLARDTHGDQPEASERLRATVQAARDRRLQDKITYSRRVMAERSSEYAERFEEDIAADLEAMREGIADAAGRMGEPAGQGRERALDQARDVARALESLGERAREGSGGDSGAAAGSGDRERQLRGEMRRRAGELRDLRRELGREGVDAGPLDEIARRLERIDGTGPIGTPRGLEQLAEAILALKDFEFALRRQMLGDEAAPAVLTAGEDVPAEYRALVEEYYRRLAERRR